ncbi:hypothetical protein Zm00014a_014007, partial [Zea mays]
GETRRWATAWTPRRRLGAY